MKRLTRMKLINWHRFANQTIDFSRLTLVSGENGAGKSTLLDAILFVVTCTTNDFNKAAHESGKRKLTGYIRCKTGRENRPFEREGDLSAHVALEFYEEEKDAYFVVGAVIDSAAIGIEKTVWYILDDARITDDLFLTGSVPRSINQFRDAAPHIRQWCDTQKAARRAIRTRFGRIEDKFFRLMPKALAFKPINDIKDFVYSYVLDEKEVNIEVLRDNIRTYQELERLLVTTRQKLSDLSEVEHAHDEVRTGMEADRRYEYLLALSEQSRLEQEADAVRARIRSEEYDLAEMTEALGALRAEKDGIQETETALRVEMKQNAGFLALEEQEKRLAGYRKEESAAKEKMEQLLLCAKEAERVSGKAADILQNEPELTQAAGPLGAYIRMLGSIGDITDIGAAMALLEETLAWKKRAAADTRHTLTGIQISLKQMHEKRKELQRKKEQLARRQLTYPEGVNRLLLAIREEFSGIGRATEPHVLCEVLEIADESYRNAVEGYLNTQRFYILVEPEEFDLALGVYEKLRRQKQAYGVGLINVRGLSDSDEIPEGSLAQMVETKNIHARRFINKVLGAVHVCWRYEDLKKYPTAITKGCMKYANHVASAIRPSVYEVPFIGNQAFAVQLALAETEAARLEEKIESLTVRQEHCVSMLEGLETDADREVKYRLDVPGEVRRIQEEITKSGEKIAALRQDTTLIHKQIRLDELEKERQEQEEEIGKKNIRIGALRQKIESAGQVLADLTAQQAESARVVIELTDHAREDATGWRAAYEEKERDQAPQQLGETYLRHRKSNTAAVRDAEEKMQRAMVHIKMAYNFGAAADESGYPEFAALYDRLRTSELLDYEEQVQKARRTAEEEFQEHFLARLQENIKQAHEEFGQLNQALGGISFSHEKYEFCYMPSKRYRNYYEMIMDDFNVIEGASIFSGTFHEKHKEVIEELFSNLTGGGDNAAMLLDAFTDYRTYMDYDIKICHDDDSYSYYSKVIEEKSGGETQTPFYVTVAASFVQLYGSRIGDEAVGLVLFDEAFNNMDDERIQGVLEFLRRLPLQIIIAAPPDKIQYISPGTDETLLVMTDGKHNFIETYEIDTATESR